MKTPKTSVRELIELKSAEFTKSDLKIARVLHAKYPIAALETMMQLAARADVSGPSVIRFVKRLGYEGYSDFQKAVHDEVQHHIGSPVALYNRRAANEGELLSIAPEVAQAAIDETASALMAADFNGAAELIATARRTVNCIGGRFTGYVAGYMSAHLHQVRPNVRHLHGSEAALKEVMVDISAKDVMIAFDVRRYQRDTYDVIADARARKASVILFTDGWGSPISEFADYVFACSVEAPSPWDSSLSTVFVAETLIAEVTKRMGKSGLARLKALEKLGVRGQASQADS